jgi:hypothetical protein
LQYEEILELMRGVPVLVDELESRHAGFVDDVLSWLRHAEQTLSNNRLPAASQIATYRARLVEAGRGVLHGGDLTIVGRPSVRRIKEATASFVLARGNDILEAVIAERQPIFLEAERMAQQALAVAQAKGLISPPGAAAPSVLPLNEVRDRIATDPDLATVYAHLVGLVGTTDTLIVLDRALIAVR